MPSQNTGSTPGAPATAEPQDTPATPAGSPPPPPPPSENGPSAPGGGPGSPAQPSGNAPESGFWLAPDDPQILIQWTLEEAKPQGPPVPGAATSYQARVRIYQQIFDAELSARRFSIPFSVADPNLGPAPFLQGGFVLSPEAPMLQVKNLKFQGFQGAMINLYPSPTPPAPPAAPTAPGGTGASGGQGTAS